MDAETRGLVAIHVGVFLLASIALFAKLISLPPTVLIFGRVLVSSVALGMLLAYSKQGLTARRADYAYLFLMGVFSAVHMVAFFQSAQVSTIAIALIVINTYPILVTILEPYFFKERFKLKNIALAGIAFLGVLLILPDFTWKNNAMQGVFFGLISSFAFSLVALINKKYVSHYSEHLLAFYQFGIPAVLLLPFLFIEQFELLETDIFPLILLGLVSAGGYWLFIHALKTMKAQRASVISMLQPVYGTVLAFFILSEVPELRTVVGGVIVLAASLYVTLKKND